MVSGFNWLLLLDRYESVSKTSLYFMANLVAEIAFDGAGRPQGIARYVLQVATWKHGGTKAEMIDHREIIEGAPAHCRAAERAFAMRDEWRAGLDKLEGRTR